MTSKDKSVWICDRCGITEEVSYSDQPMEWGGITSVKPPRAGFSGPRHHLCGGCAEDFETFMKNEVPPAVEQPPSTENERLRRYLLQHIGDRVTVTCPAESRKPFSAVLLSVGAAGATATVRRTNGLMSFNVAVFTHEIEVQSPSATSGATIE